jgi:hypothetical protein
MKMSNYRIKSLKWLAPVAIVGALGVAACGGDDQPDTVEVSSGNRAAQLADAERYVDLQKDRGSRACMWTSEINNTPVFPPSDLGAPPTPDSVLVFEKCDGEWTGNMEWLQP